MVWKANLTGNILPVGTGLTVVMKPLWVLTGSVTGVVVFPGGTVVTNTGITAVTGATVLAGRVGRIVGSGSAGARTTGEGQRPFTL